MKKTLTTMAAVLLVCALALSFAGCKNGDDTNGGDGADAWAPDIEPQEGYQLYYYLGGAYAIQVPDSWLIIDKEDFETRGLDAILKDKLDDPASFKLDEAAVGGVLAAYDAVAYDMGAGSSASFIPYVGFGSTENSVLHQTILKEPSIMASLQNEVQRTLSEAMGDEVEVREEVEGKVLGSNYFLLFCYDYSMTARNEDGVCYRALTANGGRIYWVTFMCSQSQFNETWKQICQDIVGTLEFYVVPAEHQPQQLADDTTTPPSSNTDDTDSGQPADTGDDATGTDTPEDNTGGEDDTLDDPVE